MYLGHLWPEIDLLQVDGLRSQVVQQLAQQHPVPQGLRQVEHLRRVRSHPVVHWQHVAADEPHRTLPPALHVVGRWWSVDCSLMPNVKNFVPILNTCTAWYKLHSAPSARLAKLQHRLWRTEKAAAAYERCTAGTGCREAPSVCVNFPFLLLWYFLRGGRSFRELLNKYRLSTKIIQNRSASRIHPQNTQPLVLLKWKKSQTHEGMYA